MRQGIWIGVVVVSVAMLGALWFLATHERVLEEEDIPPSGQAYAEPFLAAQRMFEKAGIEAEAIKGLEQEQNLPPNTVVLVPSMRGAISQGAIARLQSLAERGAHLIVESEWGEQPDPLLDALGVQRHAYEPDDESVEHEDEDAADGESEDGSEWADEDLEVPSEWSWLDDGWRERTALVAASSRELIEVRFEDMPSLWLTMSGGEMLSLVEGEPDWSLGTDEGSRALGFGWGEGRISVVNDSGFATNFLIGRADNAEFLWQMATLDGVPAKVLFLSAHEPGLWPWLKQHAWRSLIALALLVLLWLWSMAPRFGPVRRDPEPVRRRLLDHLRAAGRMLWSSGARAALAESARRAALAEISREHPGMRVWEPAAQLEHLQRHYGLSRSQASLLLQPQAVPDMQSFLALTRLCRMLHQRQRHRAAASDPLYRSQGKSA